MKKKLVCVMLAVILCLSVSTIAIAMEPQTFSTSQTYVAQVYHAVGVDEYGVNIREVAEVLPSTPVSIDQSLEKLHINFRIEDTSINVSANVRGKNSKGNMVYYDASLSGNDSLEILTLAYIRNFSEGAVMAQDYCEHHPEAESVLELYLKVNNSESREYYFLEIYDFSLNEFDEISSQECNADYWIAKEFAPLSSETIIDENVIVPYAQPDETKHTFTSIYGSGIYGLITSLEVTKIDDYGNIPCGGSTTWLHTLKITNKYTECPDAPEYNGDDSVISLTDISFQLAAPKNCATQYIIIDGEAKKTGIFTGVLSASVNVALGPFSASVGLKEFAENLGTIDINEMFTGFDNSDPQNMCKALNVDFSEKHYLYDTGNYMQVLVCMKDYGDVAISGSNMQSKWIMTATNTVTEKDINTGYVISGSFPIKITD